MSKKVSEPFSQNIQKKIQLNMLTKIKVEAKFRFMQINTWFVLVRIIKIHAGMSWSEFIYKFENI